MNYDKNLYATGIFFTCIMSSMSINHTFPQLLTHHWLSQSLPNRTPGMDARTKRTLKQSTQVL